MGGPQRYRFMKICLLLINYIYRMHTLIAFEIFIILLLGLLHATHYRMSSNISKYQVHV